MTLALFTRFDLGWFFFAALCIILATLPLFWISLTVQSRFGFINIRRIDIYSPPFIVAAAVFIGTTFRTAFLIAGDPHAEQIHRVLGFHLPEDVLLPGLVAINLGIFMWTMGYLFSPERQAPESTHQSSPFSHRYYWALAGIATIGLTLVAVYLHTIGLDTLSPKNLSTKRLVPINGVNTALVHLRIGGDILFVATVVHAAFYYRNSRKLRDMVILVVLAILATLLPFIASARGSIIYLALSILLVRHYLYRRISVPFMLGALILSFVLLGFLGVMRQHATTPNKTVGAESSILNTVIYTPHFIGVGKTSVIVDQIPEQVGYLLGKSYLSFLVAPIPRILWPEKPVVGAGHFTGKQLYGRLNSAGVPPGAIGEAYMNFGWVGIAAILFFMGWLCKYAYNALVSGMQQVDPWRVALYAIVMITIIDAMVTDFAGTAIRFLRLAGVFFIAFKFMRATTTVADTKTAI